MKATKAELQSALVEAQRNAALAFQNLEDLKEYLLSPKFHSDPTVQTSDVLRRIEDAKCNLLETLVL
jgi:hypothetical protein